MDHVDAVAELSESLIELRTIAQHVCRLPGGDVLQASPRFHAWQARFQALLSGWLSALKGLVPQAAVARTRYKLPLVGRWSSAMEGLSRLATTASDKVADLNTCHPLTRGENCPPSLQKLTRSHGWNLRVTDSALRSNSGWMTTKASYVEKSLCCELGKGGSSRLVSSFPPRAHPGWGIWASLQTRGGQRPSHLSIRRRERPWRLLEPRRAVA